MRLGDVRFFKRCVRPAALQLRHLEIAVAVACVLVVAALALLWLIQG